MLASATTNSAPRRFPEARSLSALMSESTTLEPSAKKRSAQASPMPWAAPVTTAILSLRRMLFPCLGFGGEPRGIRCLLRQSDHADPKDGGLQAQLSWRTRADNVARSVATSPT